MSIVDVLARTTRLKRSGPVLRPVPANSRRDGNRGRVLIIVQNLPVPFDRRVWLECQTLTAAGYKVAVVCPKGRG